MSFEGGCLCGSVRFKVEGDPVAKVQCHCRQCRYISGGSANLLIGFLESGLKFTKGKPASYTRPNIDNAAERVFCAECGTPLLSLSPAMPGVALLKVGSLDDTSVFGKADMAIFMSEKEEYLLVSDEVPQFDTVPS
tara:strand:+ start:287 stop:694 length:408 start_codon:yes stop_codon:yes gene_type:complete